jgi:hypothetical protein
MRRAGRWPWASFRAEPAWLCSWSGASPSRAGSDLRATGLLGWLAWLVYPASWPYSYLGVVGLSRCLAFAITREAFGEPLVTLGLRTYQSVARRRRDRRREAELGPMRSDRLLRDGERLVVVSCRPKEGWDETATVEIDGLYYRVDAIEDRREGEWTSVAYRLRKADAGELIRRLVRYSAPSGTLQAAGGSRRASPTAD